MIKCMPEQACSQLNEKNICNITYCILLIFHKIDFNTGANIAVTPTH